MTQPCWGARGQEEESGNFGKWSGRNEVLCETILNYFLIRLLAEIIFMRVLRMLFQRV